MSAGAGSDVTAASRDRIDRLASEGVRLEIYDVEAQCTPTRSALLLTGRRRLRRVGSLHRA